VLQYAWFNATPQLASRSDSENFKELLDPELALFTDYEDLYEARFEARVNYSILGKILQRTALQAHTRSRYQHVLCAIDAAAPVVVRNCKVRQDLCRENT
jgi:hypothetical protein